MGSSHVSSGRVSLGLAELTGLDLVDWARPASRGLNPVDPFLVLLWIFCSALEVGGVLQAGEVRGRWYLYSQDRLSILGCSTQRLFSTTSNFKRLRLRPRSFLENMNQGVKKERAEGIYVPRSIYNPWKRRFSYSRQRRSRSQNWMELARTPHFFVGLPTGFPSQNVHLL